MKHAIHKHPRLGAPWLLAGASLLITELPAHTVMALPYGPFAGWPVGGHDIGNSRSNPFEHVISPHNAADLSLKWTATTAGDVSATPAVVGRAVYFPDWGGKLWKLDARSGDVLWSRTIADYVGIAGAVSRSSPAVVGNTIYVGTQQGAYLLAIDATTGDLRWSTQLDTHPSAILTQSPAFFGGVIYQGVASSEEVAAINTNYPCCTFRGSVNAVDAFTGRVLWRTFMIPDQGSGTDIFSGAAVWGGTPAIEPWTRTVYVTTGNNYKVPQSVEECQRAGGTPSECLPPWNRINSFVALDLYTGAIKWATGQDRFDSWNGGCIVGPPPNNCPTVAGPDWDFGDGPHRFVLPGRHGFPRYAVGAGQKSGEYWMLDGVTGEVIWSASLGPGSFLGGVEWGTATDGRRIYFAETDFLRLPYTLPDGQTITTSSFGALEPATGRVVWQIPEPHGGYAIGAVSTANGVVYAGALDGHMYAMEGASGAVLWEYLGQGSSAAGPAIANGTVYWGNGYSRVATPSTTFYAFGLPRP